MLRSLLARLRRRPLTAWYHEAYRFPLPGAEASSAMETRRARDALYFLLRAGALTPESVRTPEPVTYELLAKVHTSDYLESLSQPAALAHIFAVDEADVVVDELMKSVRLACGATVEAAREALRGGPPALNLVGGFHHAFPSRGQGFCAVNDIAVAIAALRDDGFDGQVAVIDLDAHPPDGTDACCEADARVWVGSLSGVRWGPLPRADETVLPTGCSDAEYLSALDGLLSRMPSPDLVFVLAGGDILQGDKLGLLGVTLDGARQRDLRVLDRIGSVPQVWLSAGGYGAHAWKVLAGTGMALALHTDEPVPAGFDPMTAELQFISRRLPADKLGEQLVITEDDLPELFGRGGKVHSRLLGFYTREGIELALERYGILPLLRRLGYGRLHIELDQQGVADRMRLMGEDLASRQEVLLVEAVVERKSFDGATVLFVNWLSLRNPRAKFSERRPQLPGQEVPGLGLAREASTVLGLMAKRLLLDGVGFRPSWYHTAWAARHTARFVDPKRQGRFEALLRDFKDVPLLAATHALADGKTTLNGQPYTWEPDEMVHWQRPMEEPDDAAEVAAERERCHFALVAPQ